MAHLPADAAIFSPSVARHAASTAKDWAYVEKWLANKYKNRAPPPFERNNQTLQALLALANLNETADENRDLLARVEADALDELKEANDDDDDDDDGGVTSLAAFKDDFYAALEGSLTKDGTASLAAMATTAVDLGIALPSPAQLGQAMLDLQTRAFDLAQAVARVDILQRHIESSAAPRLAMLLEEVTGDEYRAPADLARQNLDMQRKVKAMAAKAPEMRDRVSSLARTVGVPKPTVQEVRREEERYLELLAVKRDLDAQIREFEGLPPDTEQARLQLDAMRKELRNITDRRDAVFENLVERETPRKGR